MFSFFLNFLLFVVSHIFGCVTRPLSFEEECSQGIPVGTKPFYSLWLHTCWGTDRPKFIIYKYISLMLQFVPVCVMYDDNLFLQTIHQFVLNKNCTDLHIKSSRYFGQKWKYASCWIWKGFRMILNWHWPMHGGAIAPDRVNITLKVILKSFNVTNQS